MSNSNIERFDSVEALNKFAAESFVTLCADSIRQRGRFTVALSGGSTPKKLYELLATDEFRSRVDWENVHVFWGDERCVPPNSPNSNYRMADEALLSKVPIPTRNVHRFFTELGEPKNVARKMEQAVREVLLAGAQSEQNENKKFPRFDLIFLGMGADGHTASLFPETAALKEDKRSVVENYVPKFDAYRLTLTYPAINNARNIIFLISGKDKTDTLNEVLNGKFEPGRLPSQAIKPVNGNLTFLIAP